jgi:predicted DNA-binding protein
MAKQPRNFDDLENDIKPDAEAKRPPVIETVTKRGRKKDFSREHFKKTSVSLPPELMKDLQLAAIKEGKQQMEIIQEALEMWLDKSGNKSPR